MVGVQGAPNNTGHKQMMTHKAQFVQGDTRHNNMSLLCAGESLCNRNKEAALALLAAHGYAGTPAFTLAGCEGWARLVDIHDGDTVTVVTEVFKGQMHRLHVRLNGIDTREIRDPDPLL